MSETSKVMCERCALRDKEEIKPPSKWLWVGVGVLIFVLVCFYLNAFFNQAECDFNGQIPNCHWYQDLPAAWGQLGDFVGGLVNPIVGVITITLLLTSNYIAKTELREARLEAGRSTAAQEKMEASMAKQLEEAKSQNNLANSYEHKRQFQSHMMEIKNQQPEVDHEKKYLYSTLFPCSLMGDRKLSRLLIKNYLIAVRMYLEVVDALNPVSKSEVDTFLRDELHQINKLVGLFNGSVRFSKGESSIKYTIEQETIKVYGGSLRSHALFRVEQIQKIHDILNFADDFDVNGDMHKFLKKLHRTVKNFTPVLELGDLDRIAFDSKGDKFSQDIKQLREEFREIESSLNFIG
jgi:hypothetical protein